MEYKIRENIYSVGAKDFDVRIFHGYLTPHGTSYNAYLIIDDEITLVDGVKGAFTQEHIDNIEKIVPLEKIDNVIINHIEPDHSGSLPAILKRLPKAKVYSVANGFKGFADYYGMDIPEKRIVKAGDCLNTGKYTFQFVPAPMVHWPDSMLTYLVEEKILFSNDALGQHLASEAFYDDEIGLETLMERASDYYANIVLPFGPQVAKLVAAAKGLDISLICPSHGVMLRGFIPEIIAGYERWMKNETREEAVVVFDTMWGSTEEMAYRIAADFEGKGIKARVIDLRKEHFSTAMSALIEAKYIAVGSSTLNRQILPGVAAFVTYMKGLAPKNRVGLAFGSYGWSGESIPQLEETLRGMGFEMLPSQKRIYMQ